MPEATTSPNAEFQYLFDRDALAIRIPVDGKEYQCIVLAELLYSRFGAKDTTEVEMERAYREHRDVIQTIAIDHVKNGWADEQGRLFLTTRFTRLAVFYGEELRAWPDGLAFAQRAQKLLTEIIGPEGGMVDVYWESKAIKSENRGVSLRIFDPELAYSIAGLFESRHMVQGAETRLHLANLWGFLLQQRSRKLILESR